MNEKKAYSLLLLDIAEDGRIDNEENRVKAKRAIEVLQNAMV
ncbi:MAG: hypothetical protein RR203_07920 [Synergistaceae bacterium]